MQAQGTRPPNTDALLISRIAKGDESALAALYDQYASQVLGLIMRVLTNRAEAEEILEEVFFQAWREANRYDGSRGTVPAWLFAIARSRAIDRIRTRQRKDSKTTSIDDAAPAGNIADDRSDPEGDSLRSEYRTIVQAALNELPAKQREVLELAYFSGLSQTEIADMTGEPLGTVKTRTRSAMMTLREKLGGVFGQMI
ncbi:MAG TPA: sigma-70 family RNA polymerase sigma factor [Blastocatellia bacterium]|nr:sigma-70 family RNA polymerase sigma factor [Blastocatellia bacterium]